MRKLRYNLDVALHGQQGRASGQDSTSALACSVLQASSEFGEGYYDLEMELGSDPSCLC